MTNRDADRKANMGVFIRVKWGDRGKRYKIVAKHYTWLTWDCRKASIEFDAIDEEGRITSFHYLDAIIDPNQGE